MRYGQEAIQTVEAMDGIACEAGVVVVSKNKIWLDGCGGRLAEMKPADTSFTSKHLGGDPGISGHGHFGHEGEGSACWWSLSSLVGPPNKKIYTYTRASVT